MESGKAARNEGGSLNDEKISRSLLLFTIKSHNFTFSLDARGLEERRKTTCGL